MSDELNEDNLEEALLWAAGQVGTLLESEPIKPRLIKWVEDSEDATPVYIPLINIVGVNTGDVGTEDEWLLVHLANGRSAQTNDPDTIKRFWEQWEIV